MEKNNQIKSIKRAIDVLECFLASESLSFNEICKKTNLSHGTVYRIINTLINRNFITKDYKSDKYIIGKGVFILGLFALKNYEFEKIVHPALEELALNTKETANASIFYDNSIIFVDSVKSSYSVKMDVKIGQRTFINSSASGKAILSYFEQEKIDEILKNSSLPKLTVNSITDKEQFKKELEIVRRKGFALDNEEEEIGLKCVGGPVFNYKGSVEGAISISGPTSRIDQNLEIFINYVKKTCSDVSSKLGYFQ